MACGARRECLPCVKFTDHCPKYFGQSWPRIGGKSGGRSWDTDLRCTCCVPRVNLCIAAVFPGRSACRLLPVSASTPCRCRLFIRAGQGARRYSWRVPPSRSRLRISRCATCSGSVIGPGSGCRGAAARRVRWGRCSLQNCSNSRSACSRWRWFQMSVGPGVRGGRSAPSVP